MVKGETKANTIEKITNYIDNRLNDNNKQDSAIMAGYSKETAKTPSLIEHTKTYGEIVNKILTENAGTLHILSSSLNKDAQEGKFEALKPLDKAQLYKLITETNDKLMPKVTVKEVQNKDGTVTRTAWGTNASQLNETMQ
jgi:hypothetical protein